MTKADLLKRAERLIATKQYDQALRLLEPKVPLFTDDSQFFYLLGQACYYKGDLNGGEIYLKRGLASAGDNIPMRQLLAITALRRRDTALAVKLWLEVLDLNPDDKRAQWALNELKDITTSADLARFIISPAATKLVPPLKKGFSKALYLIPLLALMIYLLILTINKIAQFDDLPNRSDHAIVKYEKIEPEGYQTDKGDFIYQLSNKEINSTMKKASDYFYKNQDNLALRELNRIKNSDASPEIKNKAVKWKGALAVPTFANLDSNFSYREVASEPNLYEDCYVIWRGIIGDLSIAPEQISFKLFVGYQDKKVLEGEVLVLVNFETNIEPSLTTEVLGQVKINPQGGIYLQARSIHQIIN